MVAFGGGIGWGEGTKNGTTIVTPGHAGRRKE